MNDPNTSETETLKQRLRDATEKASEHLSAMNTEERNEACLQAYLKFTQKAQ